MNNISGVNRVLFNNNAGKSIVYKNNKPLTIPIKVKVNNMKSLT